VGRPHGVRLRTDGSVPYRTQREEGDGSGRAGVACAIKHRVHQHRAGLNRCSNRSVRVQAPPFPPSLLRPTLQTVSLTLPRQRPGPHPSPDTLGRTTRACPPTALGNKGRTSWVVHALARVRRCLWRRCGLNHHWQLRQERQHRWERRWLANPQQRPAKLQRRLGWWLWSVAGAGKEHPRPQHSARHSAEAHQTTSRRSTVQPTFHRGAQGRCGGRPCPSTHHPSRLGRHGCLCRGRPPAIGGGAHPWGPSWGSRHYKTTAHIAGSGEGGKVVGRAGGGGD
jgi:hypothetical protein